jgi:hypothetical protein
MINRLTDAKRLLQQLHWHYRVQDEFQGGKAVLAGRKLTQLKWNEIN